MFWVRELINERGYLVAFMFTLSPKRITNDFLKGQAFDALSGPFCANLRAGNTPNFLSIGLKKMV